METVEAYVRSERIMNVAKKEEELRKKMYD
jgi:hypothetical protein